MHLFRTNHTQNTLYLTNKPFFREFMNSEKVLFSFTILYLNTNSKMANYLLSVLLISVCVGEGSGLLLFSAFEGDESVFLQCPVASSNFVSVLWILPEENVLIGAQTSFNPDKYQYLASTGQLKIKNVRVSDSGWYRCISELRDGGGIDRHKETATLELDVKRNYTNLWEEELYGNTVRAGVAAGLLFLTFIALCLVYKCRHKGKSYDSYKRSMELRVCPSNNTVLPETTTPPPPTGQEGSGVKGHPVSTQSSLPPNESTELKVGSRRESSNSSFLRRLSNIRMSSREARMGSEAVRSEGQAEGNDSLETNLNGASMTSFVSIGVNTDSLKAIPGSTIIYVTSQD